MTLKYTEVFVALAASNFETLVNFYSNLLNQKPNPYLPNNYAEFRLSGLKLGIFSPKKSHQSEFYHSAKTRMSLCFEVEDLEAAINHLTQMGYPPPGEIIIENHGREIYAYDAEDNRLILHQTNS
ncbi:VOC family protein [Gloeothece verrucosa]|uniref:Glyoxalase/bleomycin resistance protein/dioxygenase n=1 Tax=Gloeothece verrucosa (strain PCC 7822) TaxID=497965 RepID=E0U5A8_GLOV7|nr:VOC family protein [Gloeothece verrucosa]ADN13498.1 glyoxalase/bleomycin resistance protein/dioxygenase [Gloeothece verrucosa PCC 7822]